jgi:hypothetical protein
MISGVAVVWLAARVLISKVAAEQTDEADRGRILVSRDTAQLQAAPAAYPYRSVACARRFGKRNL